MVGVPVLGGGGRGTRGPGADGEVRYAVTPVSGRLAMRLTDTRRTRGEFIDRRLTIPGGGGPISGTIILEESWNAEYEVVIF